MEGFGARLVARARELGLTNAEVARRAGLSERRFGNYATDTREPDLQTLTVLARVLAISTDELLGTVRPADASTPNDRLMMQITASLNTLGQADLEIVAIQVIAIANDRHK